MADKLPSKEALLAKIHDYHAYIEGGGATEARADEMIGDLDRAVPHANISDLIFWGEKDRSDEEIVVEALLRETIWQEGGDLALLLYIQSQLEQGLGGASAKAVHRNYAAQTLMEVTAKIRGMQGGTRH